MQSRPLVLVPAVHVIPGGDPRTERLEVAGARGGVQVHERRRVVRHRARDSAGPSDEGEEKVRRNLIGKTKARAESVNLSSFNGVSFYPGALHAGPALFRFTRSC
jgi:hypothetical protein